MLYVNTCVLRRTVFIGHYGKGSADSGPTPINKQRRTLACMCTRIYVMLQTRVCRWFVLLLGFGVDLSTSSLSSVELSRCYLRICYIYVYKYCFFF